MNATHNGRPIIMDDEDAYAAAHGRPQPDGRDGEALLHQCCADLGVNLATALQIVCWADENLPARAMDGGGGGFSPAEQSVSIIKLARVMLSYRKAWLGNRLLLYALNNPALDRVLDHATPSRLARQADCSRYLAIKMLAAIQTELGLPLRRGQKTPVARDKMRAQRNHQLK